MKTMQTYTGADATLEILIMLLGAFLLGALLMWLYNEYFVECVEEEYEIETTEEEKDIVLKEEKNNFVQEKKEDRGEVLTADVIEDDLKIIEGVGPKIESLLKAAGLKTLKDVAEASPEQIKEILREKGGERYAFHDPSTWPDQAKLAHDGRFEELKEYQAFLSGGRA